MAKAERKNQQVVSKKHEILRDALKKAGMEKKIPIDSFLWGLMQECMQTFANEVSTDMSPTPVTYTVINQDVSIDKVPLIKNKQKEHKHEWEHLGNRVYLCANCPKWKQESKQIKE